MTNLEVGNNWLQKFGAQAAKTDRFIDKDDHAALLAAGLFGESGSIVSELKKVRRDSRAYPKYIDSMTEEVGDFLWYFARLCTILAPGLLGELLAQEGLPAESSSEQPLADHLEFGTAVGMVLGAIKSKNDEEVRETLHRTWKLLSALSRDAKIDLQEAADANLAKTRGRWPETRSYLPLFDEGSPVEEQLPRHLEIEFIERSLSYRSVVILRCNGINFGDRLTDNIEDPDGYRFHDIFHFAYAVHLGWSPVVRSLMRTKRKSQPKIDEGQDGARAGIIEEAISAIVFSRAKQLRFFEDLGHLDFDLLKTIQEFTAGFEVESVPLWQWEKAILDGYSVFRSLLAGPGGRVTLDLIGRRLVYSDRPTP